MAAVPDIVTACPPQPIDTSTVTEREREDRERERERERERGERERERGERESYTLIEYADGYGKRHRHDRDTEKNQGTDKDEGTEPSASVREWAGEFMSGQGVLEGDECVSGRGVREWAKSWHARLRMTEWQGVGKQG